MKERIVVENKAFLNKTDFVCIEDVVKDLKVEYKKEQVPETFAEFQEICEKVIDKSKHDFEAHKGFTVIDEYQFRDDGSVWLYYENVDIVRNITIFQMWLILKGIFGVSNHL